MNHLARFLSLQAVLFLGLVGCRKDASSQPPATPTAPPIHVVVTDPLSNRIACACVAGYARRDYDQWARFMEQRLGRKVQVVYADGIDEGMKKLGIEPELVIGKDALMVSDAKRAALEMHRIARLTDKQGSSDLVGLFVVRAKEGITDLKGLEGRKILFGPPDEAEKSTAAVDALKIAGVNSWDAGEAPSCNVAAMAVVEMKADAGVVSSYAMPLLEGCGTVDKGALRIVGKTRDVPFVSVFLTKAGTSVESEVRSALGAVAQDAKLCEQIESRDGFVLERPDAVKGDDPRPF